MNQNDAQLEQGMTPENENSEHTNMASLLEQEGLGLEEAMRNEFRRGAAIVAAPGIREGAARFARGEGRHGG